MTLAVFVIYGSAPDWFGNGRSSDPDHGISLPDIVQNLLLYLPFGIFGVLAWRRKTPAGRRVKLEVTALAAAFSTGLELLQLLSGTRTASPMDVAANTAGTLIGAFAAEWLENALGRPVSLVAGIGQPRMRAAVGAVVIAICAVAWYPFDVTLDVSTLSERTRALRGDPWLMPGMTELWWQAARFAVLGGLAAAWLSGSIRYAAPLAAAGAAMIAVLVDVGQLGMGSQSIGLAGLASQAAGAVCGAAVAVFWLALRRTRYAAA